MPLPTLARKASSSGSFVSVMLGLVKHLTTFLFCDRSNEMYFSRVLLRPVTTSPNLAQLPTVISEENDESDKEALDTENKEAEDKMETTSVTSPQNQIQQGLITMGQGSVQWQVRNIYASPWFLLEPCSNPVPYRRTYQILARSKNETSLSSLLRSLQKRLSYYRSCQDWSRSSLLPRPTTTRATNNKPGPEFSILAS